MTSIPSDKRDGLVRSVCPFDCPDTCSLHITLRDGKVITVAGDPAHPVTKGAICNKVRQLPDRVHHPDRLLQPMRRIGPKGELHFEPVSWDEAYDELKLGQDVLPGVLVTQGLWWDDENSGRTSVNALTPQRLADMGGGATFFSNRVEVNKL